MSLKVSTHLGWKLWASQSSGGIFVRKAYTSPPRDSGDIAYKSLFDAFDLCCAIKKVASLLCSKGIRGTIIPISSDEGGRSETGLVRMGDTGVSSISPSSSPFNSSSVFQNYPLISALVAFALAQSIKFFTTWYREKRWDPKQLIGSGGMPSSHSATVTSLATAIGFEDGFGSSLFAASMIFASIVMYDAFGVRLHAGKQAEVLNQIVYELPAEHPLAETRPLHELLGHTPTQVVAGAILGFTTASIAYAVKFIISTLS